MAREPIPQCVLPEVEVFLGDVPITKYETPGGQAFAETILPFVDKTNVIILANHGTVSYGENVERAYWWTEILDAYCRILMLAKNLGGVSYFTEEKERELLELKDKWGFADPRNTEEFKNCDICANDIFRDSWKESGVQRRAFPDPPPMGPMSTGNSTQQQRQSSRRRRLRRGRSRVLGQGDHRPRHARVDEEVIGRCEGRQRPLLRRRTSPPQRKSDPSNRWGGSAASTNRQGVTS